MTTNRSNVEIVITARDQANQALTSVNNQLGAINKTASGLGQTVKRNLGNDISVAARIGSLALAGLAGAVVYTGVSFNNLKQQANIAFTTMLGSGERAKKFLDDLQSFAARTPFEFQDLIRASQRLLAMGFAADKILPTLTAVGDAASALGASSETIDRITLALGQMQAKGKVSGEEMRQLAEAGVPAWQYIADAIGISVPEAMKKAEQGTISASVSIKALTDGMNRDFGGMMEQQSHTFGGLLSTIKDTFTQLSSVVMAPFFTRITAGMQKLVNVTNTPEFSAGVERFANSIDKVVDAFITGFGKTVIPAFKWIIDNKAAVVGAIVAIGVAFAIFHPAAAIIVGLGAIITLVGILSKSDAELSPSMLRIKHAMEDAFNFGPLKSATDFMKNELIPTIKEVVHMFSLGFAGGQIGGNLTELQTTMFKVGQVARQVVDFIGRNWSTIEDLLVIPVRNATAIVVFQVKSLYIAFRTAFGVIQGLIDVFGGIIHGDWSRIWQGLSEIVDSVWEGVKSSVKNGFELIKTAFGIGWDAVKALTTLALNALGNSVKSVLNSIIGAIESFVNEIADIKLPKIGDVSPIPHVSLGRLALTEPGVGGTGGTKSMFGDAASAMDAALQSTIKATKDTTDGLNNDLVPGLENAGQAAFTLKDALADGIIDMAEAVKLGLTPAMAAAREAEYALAQETDKAAESSFNLSKLVARLGIEIGRGAESFNRFISNVASGVLKLQQDVAGQLFGGATREEKEIQLRLAQVNEQLIRYRPVGNEKPTAYDQQIIDQLEAQRDNLQRQADLMQADNDIQRLKLELADKTLLTEQQQNDMAAQLTKTIGELSEKVIEAGGSNGIVGAFNAARDAALELATALGSVNVPSYATGITSVPRTGLALLHQGEQVLSAGSSREAAMMAGGDTYNVYLPNVSDPAQFEAWANNRQRNRLIGMGLGGVV